MSEKYPNSVVGLIYKIPQKAPEFVRGKLSIKVDEFIPYLQDHNNNGWVNIDLLKSRDGKYYAKLNEWKKKTDEEPEHETKENESDDLPF